MKYLLILCIRIYQVFGHHAGITETRECYLGQGVRLQDVQCHCEVKYIQMENEYQPPNPIHYTSKFPLGLKTIILKYIKNL